MIFGVTGQIGSYMADSLLADGYKVIGVTRRVSVDTTGRLRQHKDNKNFELVHGDITDAGSVHRVLSEAGFAHTKTGAGKAVEIYNFAASSHVALSFLDPASNWEVTSKGHLNLLEGCKFLTDILPIKLFFANSSETFGSAVNTTGYQTDSTHRLPNSPYAVAKLAASHLNRIYRDSYKLWTISGTLFNTESPRRGDTFVTRKITKWFGDLVMNRGKVREKLQLGNIDAFRDWTHAKDTVRAIRLMMNQYAPEDFLLASGESHTIQGFLHEVYRNVAENVRIEIPPLADCYEINQKFYRPNEVPYLKGYAEKLLAKGWKPLIPFGELVAEMVWEDIVDAGGREYLKYLS